MSKTHGRGAKDRSAKGIDISDIPNPIFREPGAKKKRKGMFDEPRETDDRRKRNNPKATPAQGCRRKGERRTTVYMNKDEWWMRRNYKED